MVIIYSYYLGCFFMPRVNNVIQQVSQLNTYEQGKVFEFLKNVLMSNVITNSVNEEIAENRFNKGKCCPFCNHDKISKYGKYHGKNGVKQRYKCQNPECKKTFNDFSKSTSIGPQMRTYVRSVLR